MGSMCNQLASVMNLLSFFMASFYQLFSAEREGEGAKNTAVAFNS